VNADMSNNKRKIVIGIRGMHCAACAQTIEKNLKMDGVYEVYVNFAAEKASITYNPKIITLKKIKTIISDIGR